ncbi:MAG: hypothetical protein ACRCS9_06775 [Hyphomicrobium sp.]
MLQHTMMSRSFAVGALALGFAVGALASSTPADAARRSASTTWRAPVARDCTPMNGRYGYYGNLWCDRGAHRVEDVVPLRQLKPNGQRRRYARDVW